MHPNSIILSTWYAFLSFRRDDNVSRVDDPPPQPEVRRTFTRGDVTTYMNYYPDPPDFIHLGFTHDDVIIPRLEAVDYSD
jgi:hypothetical protein